MKSSNDKVAIQPSLVAGRDYPRTYREFVEMFPDDEACAAYLEQLRWPNGFFCPACKITTEPWHQTRSRLVCPSCRHQTSVSAGTILDKTRTPLTTWFEAGWHLTTAKNGLSAKTLERTLGTSYRVAWTMLQRYRVAMVRAEREPLSGDVEVDETLVGGVKKGGKRGRGTSKCIVVIAVEVKQPKGFGRVRMRYIPDASGANLIPFVCDMVMSGSVAGAEMTTFLAPAARCFEADSRSLNSPVHSAAISTPNSFHFRLAGSLIEVTAMDFPSTSMASSFATIVLSSFP